MPFLKNTKSCGYITDGHCSAFLCEEKPPPAPMLLLIPKKSLDFWGALTWAERSRLIFERLSHVGAKYILLRSDFLLA